MTNLYASVSTAKLALLVFYCITSKLKKFCARPFIRTLDTVAISSRNLPLLYSVLVLSKGVFIVGDWFRRLGLPHCLRCAAACCGDMLGHGLLCDCAALATGRPAAGLAVILLLLVARFTTKVSGVMPCEASFCSETCWQVKHCKGTSCLLYTSPSPRDRQKSRMPSSA